FLHAGIDLDYLVGITALKKRIRLDQAHQFGSMGRVAGDDEDERLDDPLAIFAGVGFKIDLHAFVKSDAILQLHHLNRVGRFSHRVEVTPGDHGRLLNEAVLHRAGKRVVENHIAEWHGTAWAFDERRGGQLKAKHRL